MYNRREEKYKITVKEMIETLRAIPDDYAIAFSGCSRGWIHIDDAERIVCIDLEDLDADYAMYYGDLFDEYTSAEILQTARRYIESKIQQYNLDVTIVDAAIYGSRSRGEGNECSDLDIVVEYTGDISEDAFFNILHEDNLTISDVVVDINPITKHKTGTIKEYLRDK